MVGTGLNSSDRLWAPSPRRAEHSNLAQFAQRYAPTCDPRTQSGYAALHAWSVRAPGYFWRAIWEECGVVGDPGSIDAVAAPSLMDWAWFPEARLNYAQNLLQVHRRHEREFASQPAVVACDERGNRCVWSRGELIDRVLSVAQYFQSLGIQPGDRIAAVLPNSMVAIVGYLASAAVGAVWSSCSPDFGSVAIRDRFGQIEPKLLLTSEQTTYNGKIVRPIDRVRDVLAHLPTVQQVLVERCSELNIETFDEVSTGPFDATWADWQAALNFQSPTPWQWPVFPFNQPLCIVYSSGTTGIPKCIVHGAGGTLLQHLKEHRLHCDLRDGDSMLYYTTTGWMMWNWLVGSLASGAIVVAYDGSPIAPTLDAIWRLASELHVTHFGASARYYAMLDKAGCEPKGIAALEDLRCVLSTGSPLMPETFDWVYRSVKADVHLASISGGTDILSCFVLGNPSLPVHRGEIQVKGLGMDVQILDAERKKVVEEPGELVCTNAFPSMPIHFWNDPDRTRYRRSYFEKIEGVWCHGDWARETAHGGFVIFGRSDATLNPGGVRIGTSEIYQQVEAFPEIAEAIATARKFDGDEQIVLFVRMSPGHTLSAKLVQSLCSQLRSHCSPRHVPAIIESVDDLPRTISGKLSEIAVRNAISGMALGNDDALANPECLDYFRAWKPRDSL